MKVVPAVVPRRKGDCRPKAKCLEGNDKASWRNGYAADCKSAPIPLNFLHNLAFGNTGQTVNVRGTFFRQWRT